MRRLLRYPVACLLALFSFLFSTAQNSPYPNTLLWRITGKGLKAPSYLYGTMHLQDKRLFNFGDSLYQSLESVEGLATEIDFKELVDSMFTKGIHKAQDQRLEAQKLKLDKTKLDRSTDSLFKALNIDKNSVTKKDLKKIRDYRVNRMLQKGEMQTIVDGYLVGLAMRQHKWVGGIEDVTDQLNMFDEIGADLPVDEIFQTESAMRKGLEQMIQMYLKEDLTAISNNINGYNNEVRDALLTQRNLKMARRMDSLSAIRTMFFAVGAAHLPGDSGVINLLRNNGFTVEPVFSSQRIPAEVYRAKLQDIPWYTVEEENKMYTVEMPGNPSQFNEFGEALKMRMYFDVTTMTFYMATQTIGTFNNNKDFEDEFKAMLGRMGAPPRSSVAREVSRNGMQARETIFEREGISFKVQLLHRNNSLFVLVAGSVNKRGINSPDVNRFFQSFTAKDVKEETKSWVRFSLPEKAFSLMLPGQPKKNPAIDKQASGSSWTFTSYDLADNVKGVYYMIQVRDMAEGYYLNGDSAYFNAYVEETSQKMDTVLRAEFVQYKGYPAFYFDAVFNKSITYRTFHVIRGNRVYLLLAGGSSGASASEAETLFNSLVLEDYAPSEWKTYTSEGFSTTAPAPIKKVEKKEDDAEEEDTKDQFVSYSPTDAISYQILKETLPPLYWIQDDSAFFAEREKAYVGHGDTVLQKSIAYNGKLKAFDMQIQRPDQNNIFKVRLIATADTLYTLMAFIEKQYMADRKHSLFFDNFKVQDEAMPNIYTSKAEKLLQALRSKDSTVFAKAAEVFATISFTKYDLPFLHSILLEAYPDSYLSGNIYDKSLSSIREFKDTSSVSFVENHYAALAGEKEGLKYNLLQVLADNKSAAATEMLKKLVAAKLPAAGDAYGFVNALLDSMALAAALYSHLVPFSSDSIFSDAFARMTWTLLDSGLVDRVGIEKYRQGWVKQAEKKFDNAKAANQEEDWAYYHWIKLLQELNDKESNGMLQKFAASSSLDVKYSAIQALIQNKQALDPLAVEKLAADHYYRVSLYSSLKEDGRLNLFPARFHNQKSIAESELFSIAADDGEPSKMEAIGERVLPYRGKRMKFYLFKVTYDYQGGSKETYLGVAGPFDISSKEIKTETEATGLVSELYNAKKTDQQLKDYLAEMEEYEAE